MRLDAVAADQASPAFRDKLNDRPSALSAPWTLVDSQWTPNQPVGVMSENESDV
jgi:hypothetical protein